MPLGAMYPSPGFCDEIVHLYFCRVKEFAAPNPDEDEFLEIEKIPLNKAAEMVLNNQIPDAKTQIAVLKTYFLMKEGNSTADECL
jgi:ADP-ribose pyrophosphatase